MWIYYEDKGMHIGMCASRHESVKQFVQDGLENSQISKKSFDVKLPNFDKPTKMSVLVHKPSFMGLINLDCLNCSKSNVYGSCCGGAPVFECDISSIVPLIMDGSLIPYVREEYRGILERCMYEQTTEYVYNDNTRRIRDYHNGTYDKECVFRGEDRCGLHAYLLEHGIPYYMKPCTWMYPFDFVLELDHSLNPVSIMMFVVCEQTSHISRWGKDSWCKRCLDINIDDYMRENKLDMFHGFIRQHTDSFLKKDYRPAYLSFHDEIEYMLGHEAACWFDNQMRRYHEEHIK